MIKQNPNIVVLLPAYNEASSIRPVITSIVDAGYSVICIDDGSTDQTASIASDSGALVIRHFINLGQGAAIETGFEMIRRHYDENTITVTFDADGQHNVSEISEFTRIISETDAEVVLGSRFLKGQFKGGVVKKSVLIVMSSIARITMKIRITDRHNGFRAFSMESLKKIRINNSGFGHADEILRQISHHKIRFSECNTDISYTEYSMSKGQPLINGVRLILDRFLGAP